MTESDLTAFFSVTCGNVVSTQVKVQQNERYNCAFVNFEDEEAAKCAICLPNPILGGVQLRILPSQVKRPSRGAKCFTVPALWVGNLWPEDGEDHTQFLESLKQLFEAKGHSPTEVSRIMRSTHTWYVFMWFATIEEAQAACAMDGVSLGGRNLLISPKESRSVPSESSGVPGGTHSRSGHPNPKKV